MPAGFRAAIMLPLPQSLRWCKCWKRKKELRNRISTVKNFYATHLSGKKNTAALFTIKLKDWDAVWIGTGLHLQWIMTTTKPLLRYSLISTIRVPFTAAQG